jgi:hypothetical protein
MVALTPLALQLAVAVAAGIGAWKCLQLQRYATDPRLTKLAWFFGLFALSMLFAVIWSIQADAAIDAIQQGNGRGRDRPHGEERVTSFLVLQHFAMLGSLIVAVQAFGRPKRPTAEIPPGVAVFLPLILLPLLAQIPLGGFGRAIPLLLAAEATLTLYLAVRALLNHMERRTPGAMQVAAGFALFFFGHLVVYLSHVPGATRTAIGDILALVGMVLLVQLLPGRR